VELLAKAIKSSDLKHSNHCWPSNMSALLLSTVLVLFRDECLPLKSAWAWVFLMVTPSKAYTGRFLLWAFCMNISAICGEIPLDD